MSGSPAQPEREGETEKRTAGGIPADDYSRKVKRLLIQHVGTVPPALLSARKSEHGLRSCFCRGRNKFSRRRWTKGRALLSTATRRAFLRCTSHLVVLQGRGRPSAAGPLISRREANPPLPQARRIPSLHCPIRCCARARRSRCHRATILPRRSGRRRSTQHVHETSMKARARDRRLPFISRAGEGRAASALASAASLECPLKRAKARHALCLLGLYAVGYGRRRSALW